jgi:hypothetical protein
MILIMAAKCDKVRKWGEGQMGKKLEQYSCTDCIISNQWANIMLMGDLL